MKHFISLATGVQMTTTYRSNKDQILKQQYLGQNILPLSETFDREAFEALLSKSGCKKLRIYYGMDESLKVHAIIVAVDADNRDILPAATLTEDEEDDYLVELGQRCPTICPEESPLNP